MAKKIKTTKTSKSTKSKSSGKNVETFTLRQLVNTTAGNGTWERDGGRRLRRVLRKSPAHAPVGDGGKHEHRAPWTCVRGDRDHTTMVDVIKRVYA